MLTKKVDDAKIRMLCGMIDEAEHIVLTCHVRPDGDAVGSTLGMAILLRSIGKKAVVVTPDLPPRSLSFLPEAKEVVAYSKYPDFAKRLLDESDLILCCDFNKLSRLDMLEPLVAGTKGKKVLIDHHEKPDSFADLTISCPDMSSTCELMFRLICDLGLYQELPLDAATCLTTGLITDTRNFSVNCSDPEIYTVLIKLLEKGVDKPMIVREAIELKSLDSLRLQVHALDHKMEIFESHSAAVITIGKEELERFNYQRGDTEGLVNVPLSIPEVTYSIFIREDAPDYVKISMRSKGDFSVSRICEEHFNGGGHTNAAGGEFKGPLKEALQLLLEIIPTYDKYLV